MQLLLVFINGMARRKKAVTGLVNELAAQLNLAKDPNILVFLHYNDCKTLGSKDNMFDKRIHLGLPSWFKK